MYKINVTVKDLDGFSLSIEEMDKVLKPDSLQATVEKALAMTDDELAQAWGEAVDELDADDTIIVSRQYAQQLHDECAAIADMTGKWLGETNGTGITREQAEEMAFGELVQKLSIGSVPCSKCEKPVTSEDCVSAYILYDFTGDNPEAVVLCPACESSNPDRRLTSIKLNGWHQRNNPGGPDEVPTATIARADLDDLLKIRDEYNSLLARLGIDRTNPYGDDRPF